MEELEKQHDPIMGFYFSCQHCQQKNVSADCVQEHSANCHMQPSSFMIPKITSYSSLNPQATDLNFDSEGFPIRHEIIKKEPEDYIEDDNTDWQGETEDSTVSNPADMSEAQDDAPSPRKLPPRLARQKAKFLLDSDETEEDSEETEEDSDETKEDSALTNPSHDVPNQLQVPKTKTFPKILRDSFENPNSTRTEDRYLCHYCPRTFAYRCLVRMHERRHGRERKYSCSTCGKRFRWPGSLVPHMKTHEPDGEFPCCYPGCPQTFKSPFKRWTHHKTHPRGQWRERGRWPRKPMKYQKSNKYSAPATIIPKSENCTGNESIKNPVTASIKKSSKTNRTEKSSKNARGISSKHSIKSHDQYAQLVPCCYPGCPKSFKSKFKLWIHHKTHPKGQWNKSERRPRWSLRPNQKTSKMPPKLTPEKENSDSNQSMETSSMTDLSIEGSMTHSEIEFTNNLELDNTQQSASIDATISQEPRDSNFPFKTHRRGRPARPGYEIEIMTAWGRKFKCDICHKMFATRDVAKYHRLSHFDEPQISCYIPGCSQIFYTRVQRINHLKSVHHVKFRKGRPFIGARRVAFNITGPRKVIAKEITPNVNTARQPSKSPPKIQLNKRSKPDQNIHPRSDTEELSPVESSLFTCGICCDNFENLNTLKRHMLTIHAGPEDSQAELEDLGLPVDNTIGNVDFSCEGGQVPVEMNENQATSNLPLNLTITNHKGSVPRYPIVNVGGIKHFYCGFPHCDEVFYNRTSRYTHHKKFHNNAHQSLLASLAYHPEKKANQTSSTQLKEQDMDSPPDFPFVEVNGKKYFWCDVPDCGVVVTNLEARRLHPKKHQMSSEQTTIAENPVGSDSKKRIVSPNAPKQLQDAMPEIAEKNEDELLGETSSPNKPEMSEFSMQSDKEMPAQSLMLDDGEMPTQAPMQVLAAVVDQHFEADERQEMSDLQNQSMDTLQLTVTDDNNPVEPKPVFSNNFNEENIVEIEDGLGSELSTEASSASNPALRNISNPTSTKTDKVVQRPLVVKERRSVGRPALYPVIQIGSSKLLCCGFPDCTGVFKTLRTRSKHHRGHRMGRKVNSKLKLTEDGMVMDSADGSYVTE